MRRIGIICSTVYENKRKVKEIIFKIKTTFKDEKVEIVSRGNINGAEKHIKKYCMELGMDYKEFNPPHTNQNLYSAMSEMWYNKPFSPGNFHVRDHIFSKYVDTCFCLSDSTNDLSVKGCLRNFKKYGKNYVILD